MSMAPVSKAALDLVDLEVRSFTYSGARVDCRLEVERDGKKEQGAPKVDFTDETCTLPEGPLRGRFVWVRSAPDSAGKERWWIGHERSVPQGGDKTPFCSTKVDVSPKLWKPQTEEGQVNRTLGRRVVGSIPAVLPLDGEFGVLTVTDQRGDERVEVKIMCHVQK